MGGPRGTAVAALAATLALLASAACGGPTPLRRTNTVRITIAGGCADAIAAFDGVKNPDAAGLGRNMVPPEPTRGLVCRYATTSGSGDGGNIARSIPMASGGAKLLARDLDRIQSTGSQAHSCGGSPESGIDVLVLAYPG